MYVKRKGNYLIKRLINDNDKIRILFMYTRLRGSIVKK